MIFSTLLSTVAFAASQNLGFNSVDGDDQGASTLVSVESLDMDTTMTPFDDGHSQLTFGISDIDGNSQELYSLSQHIATEYGISAPMHETVTRVFLTSVDTNGTYLENCKLNEVDTPQLTGTGSVAFAGAFTNQLTIKTDGVPFESVAQLGTVTADWAACGATWAFKESGSNYTRYNTHLFFRVDALTDSGTIAAAAPCGATVNSAGALDDIKNCRDADGAVGDIVYFELELNIDIFTGDQAAAISIDAGRRYAVAGDNDATVLQESATVVIDSNLRRCNSKSDSEADSVRPGEVFCMEHYNVDEMPRSITWLYPGFDSGGARSGANGVGIDGSMTSFYLPGSGNYLSAITAEGDENKNQWAVKVVPGDGGADLVCVDGALDLKVEKLADITGCRYEAAMLADRFSMDASAGLKAGVDVAKEHFAMVFFMQTQKGGSISSTWKLSSRPTDDRVGA